MNNALHIASAVAAAAAFSSTTLGAYNITQGSSAPTYSNVVDFDQVGDAVGVGLPDNAYASYGISDLVAGDSINVVGDNSGSYPWVNDGNSFFGNFGVFMKFDSDLTEFSGQFWDPSGPPSFFGGGMNVILFDDGVQVWDVFAQTGDILTPAWGGIGDEWIDITTSGGMVFDEIRVLGYGFGPTTLADNLSWNEVPTPGALALFGIAGLAAGRRRRN